MNIFSVQSYLKIMKFAKTKEKNSVKFVCYEKTE